MGFPGCCHCSIIKLCLTLCDPIHCRCQALLSSLSPGVCSDSYPLSWCCSLIILCQPLLLLPSILPSIRVFSNESAFCIRWPKYWSFSFSISPSNESSGPISFRMDCFDLLSYSPRDSQESSPAPQFKSINSLVLSLLYGPTHQL